MLTEVENQPQQQYPSPGVNGWKQETAEEAGEEAAPDRLMAATSLSVSPPTAGQGHAAGLSPFLKSIQPRHKPPRENTPSWNSGKARPSRGTPRKIVPCPK